MKDHWPASGRREFLWTLGGGALGLALAGSGYPTRINAILRREMLTAIRAAAAK